MGCMTEYDDALRVCPFCNHACDTPAKEAYHLAPGSILSNKYIVGKVLGYGGFGVTYIGYDAQLGRKVAIKEYMPGDFSTRMPGSEVMTVYKGDASDQFAAGLQRFIDEARRLAKFNALPGIVEIYDSFLNNSTGYIVMEYLEGATVKELLAKNGPFEFDEALRIILGMLSPLKEVHKSGIIHRDIAPDNIFLIANGGVKLIDFGAARYATTLRSKSLSVILKPGYAPEEQYRSHGQQGPWSDVYAIAATFYKMITGVTPDEAMDRKMRDTLKPPSLLGVKLPKSAENAIMNALNVNAENRPQSAAEFEEALLSSEVTRNKVRIKKADSGRLPIWVKIPAGVAALALVIAGVLAATVPTAPEQELPWRPGYVIAPGVIKQALADAQTEVEEAGLTFMITDKRFDKDVSKDLVLLQDPKPGAETEIGSVFSVVVSGGAEKIPVKDVVDMYKDEAAAELEALGFSVAFLEEYSAAAQGAILRQSPDPDSEAAPGALVTLIVSKGAEEETAEIQELSVPNLVGENFSEAKALLGGMGLYIVKGKEIYSAAAPKNRITAQSPKAGARIKTGQTVSVTVSLGNEKTVPDVQYKTEAQAVQLLSASGFSAQIKYEESATVQKDHVIRQSVRAGSKAAASSVIVLTVSSGKTVTAPNVVGKSRAEAQTALTSLGIQVRIAEEYSDKIAKDTVISQSVKSGTVKVGDTITITVSLGKEAQKIEEAQVPDVVGKSLSDAQTRLQKAGFSIHASEQFSDSVKSGIVLSQSIAPGTFAQKATSVTLVVSKGPEDKQQDRVPDVTWNTESAARSTLQSKGFLVGDIEQRHNDTFPAGYVISQSPIAATVAKLGSKVNLVVSKGPEKVVAVALSEIFVSSPPAKREYLVGESFASSGLVVLALYGDGSSKNVTSACNLTGFDSTSEGTKTITVSYSEKTISRTARFTVAVKKPDPVDPVPTPDPPPVDLSWQTTPLPQVQGYTIEERREYRYRNRETMSDTSPTADGWTLYETKEEWGPWNGTWLDADPGKSASRDTMTRQEAIHTTQIHYEHWKYWNASANAYDYKGNSNLPNVSYTYEELYASSPLSQYGNTADGMAYWTGSGAVWYNPREVSVQTGTRTEWQYRDKIPSYHFERWGAWSDWIASEDPPVSSSEQTVEVRVVYRYVPA
ncbi:MAG: PASTA domain-containing protein [Clostridiales Family XIII bacterium]|nr:PASTA domain-containing protein [Clostridiales Family XIII bacterium]